MIRANLKAGGSIASDSAITAVTTPTTITVNGISSDAEAVFVTNTASDLYGSNFDFIARLDDLNNPIYVRHSGEFTAVSTATYSNGTLVLTLASGAKIGAMTISCIPLKVS